MPKKIKNVFYQSLTFEKLMQAHKRARKHKAFKKEVIWFEINLENNITNLLNNIKHKTYKLGDYRSFIIYEPKQRIIQALPYVDRITHQWYVEEFIKPYFVPKFIYSTYACLDNKGTHMAVKQVQQYMRTCEKEWGYYWILKCDIAKYFYNINTNILFNIMQKYIADKDLLDFTKIILFSGRVSDVGIPIGNYTSQFFANIYLNELDQYLKRVLKIKYYTRYMDDFVLLLQSKEDCIVVKELIENFIGENLKISLNAKSRFYPCNMGVNFCGYRIFSTHRLLRTSSKKNIKKKVKIWNALYKNGNLDSYRAIQSLNSWIGHSSHCNSYKLQNKIIKSVDFLYNDYTSLKVQENLINDMDVISHKYIV